MKKIFNLTFLLILSPSIAFAALDFSSFSALVNSFIVILSLIVPILVSVALLGFLWGIAKFILHTGGGKEQEEAKNVMFWGIIALFVMISVWGIVGLLKASLIGGSATGTVIFPDEDFVLPPE